MHCICCDDLKKQNLRGKRWVHDTQDSLIAELLEGNAGDSRSVLGVKGRAKPLSYDHKPSNEGQ